MGAPQIPSLDADAQDLLAVGLSTIPDEFAEGDQSAMAATAASMAIAKGAVDLYVSRNRVKESTDIYLDLVGRERGVYRQLNETDDAYRARIEIIPDAVTARSLILNNDVRAAAAGPTSKTTTYSYVVLFYNQNTNAYEELQQSSVVAAPTLSGTDTVTLNWNNTVVRGDGYYVVYRVAGATTGYIGQVVPTIGPPTCSFTDTGVAATAQLVPLANPAPEGVVTTIIRGGTSPEPIPAGYPAISEYRGPRGAFVGQSFAGRGYRAGNIRNLPAFVLILPNTVGGALPAAIAQAAQQTKGAGVNVIIEEAP